MQHEDTQPWYRQFWPWFLIALPAAAVIAGLYTVWLSMQTSDSLVIHADDGLNTVTTRNLAAEETATRLGLSFVVDIQPDSGAVLVTLLRSSDFERPSSLRLTLRHPTMASRDANIELLQAIPTADGQPTWAGHFIAVPDGRLHMTLSSGDQWRLSGEWAGQARFRLGSGDPIHHGGT